MLKFVKPHLNIGWHVYWVTPIVLLMVVIGYVIYPFVWTYKFVKSIGIK